MPVIAHLATRGLCLKICPHVSSNQGQKMRKVLLAMGFTPSDVLLPLSSWDRTKSHSLYNTEVP